MRAITMNEASEDLRQPSQSVWQYFMPFLSDEEGAEKIGVRSALRKAEMVIRAQEERIRHLEEMALTDELTGLANRRAFMSALERELALTRRDVGHAGILVMIDLDGFKGINDKWGHHTGDAYLCAVAEALIEEMRSTDIVARLGGDEFALLFTGMDEETGKKRIAKLEENFKNRAIEAAENIPLRASFGIAAYSGSDKAESVMRLADLRLYAKKNRGQRSGGRGRD